MMAVTKSSRNQFPLQWKMRTSVVLAAAMTSIIALSSAQAQSDSDLVAAEALFEEGRQLMAAERYDEACVKFAASHELDPSVGALLNLANCYEQGERIASAWAEYRRAEALARQNRDRRRARIARQRASAIEGERSYLTISVPAAARVDGLVVERNGQALASALWDQRSPIDGGTYVIRARAPGYLPSEVKVTVAPRRDDAQIAVPALEPEPVVERPAQPQPQGPSGTQGSRPGDADDGASAGLSVTGGDGGSSSSDGGGGMPLGRKLALVSGGLGVLGLSTSAILGVRASSQWDDAKNTCTDGDLGRCTNEGVAMGEDAQTSANWATTMFVVGGVASVGAAVLWFTSSSNRGTERAARIEPLLAPGTAGAQVHMRF